MATTSDDKQSSSSSPKRRTSVKIRANSRGDTTRQLLLSIAEQLFAERGIAAVPLRDIGIAADQKNHAVVQYHFGDKETLVAELFTLRAQATEERRVQLFGDLMERGQPKVADLVNVFVFALASHLEPGNHYLAFMSRYIIEHGGYSGLDSIEGLPSATVSTLMSILDRLLANYPREVLEERWMVTMTSAVHTMARYQAVITSGADLGSPIEELLEDLVVFLTAGIEAPVRSPDSRPRTSGSKKTRMAAERRNGTARTK